MAAGQNAHLGVAKENSWGTPLAATDYVPLTGSTLVLKKDYIARPELRGNWAEPNRELATREGMGDVSFLARANVWGYFLRSFFGPSSSTMVASTAGGVTNQHVFMQTTSRYSPDIHLWPLTMELYRDTGLNDARQWIGAVCPTLKINVAAGKDPITKVTATILSKNVGSVAATTQSFELYGPYDAWMAAVTLDGAPSAIFESLDLTLNAPLDSVFRMNQSQQVAALQRNNYMTVALAGKLTFNDETTGLWDRFNQDSVGPLDITFTNSAPGVAAITSGYWPKLDINLPLLQLTEHKVDIRGPQRLVADIVGYGQYHVGSLTAIMVTLLNERNAY